MLAILNPGESLTAVMSGAAATTNPYYFASWREDNGKPNQPTGSLSGATPVTLAAAPNAGQREVSRVGIFNADTAAVTVTIAKVVSGTSYTLAKATIPVGGLLTLTASGVQVVDSSGQLLQTISDSSGIGTASGTGVVAAESGSAVRKTVLSLTNAAIVLADNAGVVAFGSLKVYDFPAGAIQFLGATANLALTKSSAGVNVDWDGDIGIGSAAAGNSATLTGTEQDLIPSTATPQAVAGATTGNAQSTITQAGLVLDGTGTAADVFLNLLVDDADHDVTGTACNLIANGTITIYWLNLGDY